jgi:hypothetical protein
VKFSPVIKGNYARKYGIAIVGWKTIYTVIANGVADIPFFDKSPCEIFPNVS